MKKLIAFLVLVPPLLFAAFFGYLLYRGPRMTVQHHLREFQGTMPAPVPGTVAATRQRVQEAGEGATAALRGTPQELEKGRTYYRYYCVFCHGETGAGDGPVGRSYHPVPADLRSAKVAGYGEGEMLRVMLRGVGHEPVLERAVPPEHRRHLAAFVRSLAGAAPSR